MAAQMFFGRTEPTLDAKCRLFLPEQLRSRLGDGFMLSLTTDLRTVCLYPEETWNGIYEMVSRMNPTDEQDAEYQRIMLSSTFVAEPDSTGRILIPQALRAPYGLTEGSTVVLAGAGNRVEIWNAAEFYNNFAGATNRKEIVKHINEKYYSAQTNDTKL